MPFCEICGNETKRTYKRKIAGAILDVCAQCKDLGTPVDNREKKEIIKRKQQNSQYGIPTTRRANKSYPSQHHRSAVKPKKERKEKLRVVDNYIDLLVKIRTKNGLSRDQFADSLKIQRSYYHRIEKGTTALPLDLAIRIGKKYNISLVERDEDEEDEEEVLSYMEQKAHQKDSTMGMIYFRKRGQKPDYL